MFHGSTPRTPPHRLTLHEYRKQCRSEELTPPPSAGEGSRRVKRKRGERNLSIDLQRERERPSLGSTSASPPLWSFPITPQEQQDQFGPLHASSTHVSPRPNNPYSFATVFRPFDSQQYWQTPSTRSHETIGTVIRVGDYHRPFSAPIVADRTRSLKPHKRLPRPGELQEEDQNPISLRPRDLTLSFESFGGTTDTSTSPSLSRFPHPPTNLKPSPLNNYTDFEQLPPPDEDKPTPPTVLHLRGISFDLVNPHSSLQLQDIETPMERDSEPPEYFHLGAYPSHASTSDTVSIMLPRTVTHENEDAKSTSTPPRAIFPNLQSAYNSIRKGKEMILPKNDLPLPPIPIPTTRNSPLQAESCLIVPEAPPVSPFPAAGNWKLAPAPSFRQRFSRAFHRKTKSANSERTLQPFSFQNTIDHHGNKRRDTIHLLTTSEQDLESRRPNSGEGLQRSARSEGKMSVHYYDFDSIYDSSLFRRDSELLNDSQKPIMPPLPSPSGVSPYETNSRLIDTYPDDLTNHPTPPHTPIQTMQNGTRHLLQSEGQPDSTIGSILEQYHRLHDAQIGSPPNSKKKHATDAGILAQNEAFMESMRQLRPSTSGLSQFEFGFDANGSTHDTTKVPFKVQTMEEIRQATARALGSFPGAGPAGALPPDPNVQLRVPKPTFLQRSLTENSESMSWLTSYSDTRHLLGMSQELPEIEAGRGRVQENLHPEMSSSPGPTLVSRSPFSPQDSNSRNISGTSGVHLAPPSIRDTAAEMRRHSDLSLRVVHDLNRISTISGLSELSGSFFVVNNTGAPTEDEFQYSRDSARTSILLASSYGNGNENSQESFESRHNSTKSNYVPIAAFSPRVILPGIWRMSEAGRQKLKAKQQPSEEPTQQTNESSREEELSNDADDEGNDLDWETIPESRRGVSTHRTASSSVADYNSLDSLSTLRNVSIHPGDSRYQHVYRFHSPQNSEGPVLLPSYDFHGGAGFPNRNAVPRTEPLLYTTYNYPSPLPTHQHPFSNSPPQIGSGSPPDRPAITTFGIRSEPQKTRSSLSPFFWSGANLSVVHEATREGSLRDTERNPRNRNRSNPLNRIASANFKLVRSHSSSQLNGPSSSLEAEQGTPYDNSEEQSDPPSPLPSSGMNALMHRLREGEHRMGSSPLERHNSFAKLSHLGPDANITGTPNGTGMRHAGSSMVGSSSPFELNQSGSTRKYYTTPPTPPSSPPLVTRSVPLAKDPDSPLAQYDERHYGTKFNTASTIRPVRNGSNAAAKTEHYVRPYVAGQSQLLDLRLAPPVVPANAIPKPWTGNAIDGHYSRKGIGSQIRQPLLPMVERDAFTVLRDSPRGRSQRTTRAPSSIATSTRSRKQFLSWTCLLIAILFPPLTLLYGLSKLDIAMFTYTKGDIEHFGRRQKKVALFGVPLSLGIWTLIILLATIH